MATGSVATDVGSVKPRRAQAGDNTLDLAVDAFEGQAPGQRDRGGVVLLEHPLLEQARDFAGDRGGDEGIAIAVAARPKADLNVGTLRQVLWQPCATVRYDQHARGDAREHGIEHVFEGAQDTACLVHGCRTLVVGKARLAKLEE